jgi:hypothetical protein
MDRRRGERRLGHMGRAGLLCAALSDLFDGVLDDHLGELGSEN